MSNVWKSIENFKPYEFDSPDLPGSGEYMNSTFMLMLDMARDEAGISFVVSSGARTPAHNKKVGGVADSAHVIEVKMEGGEISEVDTRPQAADIEAEDSNQRFIILRAAILSGFNRIGIAKTFIHLDNDKSKPPKVGWLY